MQLGNSSVPSGFTTKSADIGNTSSLTGIDNTYSGKGNENSPQPQEYQSNEQVTDSMDLGVFVTPEYANVAEAAAEISSDTNEIIESVDTWTLKDCDKAIEAGRQVLEEQKKLQKDVLDKASEWYKKAYPYGYYIAIFSGKAFTPEEMLNFLKIEDDETFKEITGITKEEYETSFLIMATTESIIQMAQNYRVTIKYKEITTEEGYVNFNYTSCEYFRVSSYDISEEIFDILTEDEKKLLLYLESKNSSEVEIYLDEMEDMWNQRAAQARCQKRIDSLMEHDDERYIDELCNMFNVSVHGLGDGIATWAEGLINAFSADGTLSISEYERMYYLEYLTNNTKVLDNIYTTSSAIGNMLPTVTISLLLTKGLVTANLASFPIANTISQTTGAALIGFSSYGNTLNQSLYQGMDRQLAQTYSAVMAGSESLMEFFMGGIFGLGANASKSFIVNLGQEGLEEALTTVLQEGIIDTIFLNQTLDLDRVLEIGKNAGESFFTGILVAGAINGYTNGVTNILYNGNPYTLSTNQIEQILEYKKQNNVTHEAALRWGIETFLNNNSSQSTQVSDYQNPQDNYSHSSEITIPSENIQQASPSDDNITPFEDNSGETEEIIVPSENIPQELQNEDDMTPFEANSEKIDIDIYVELSSNIDTNDDIEQSVITIQKNVEKLLDLLVSKRIISPEEKNTMLDDISNIKLKGKNNTEKINKYIDKVKLKIANKILGEELIKNLESLANFKTGDDYVSLILNYVLNNNISITPVTTQNILECIEYLKESKGKFYHDEFLSKISANIIAILEGKSFKNVKENFEQEICDKIIKNDLDTIINAGLPIENINSLNNSEKIELIIQYRKLTSSLKQTELTNNVIKRKAEDAFYITLFSMRVNDKSILDKYYKIADQNGATARKGIEILLFREYNSLIKDGESTLEQLLLSNKTSEEINEIINEKLEAGRRERVLSYFENLFNMKEASTEELEAKVQEIFGLNPDDLNKLLSYDIYSENNETQDNKILMSILNIMDSKNKISLYDIKEYIMYYGNAALLEKIRTSDLTSESIASDIQNAKNKQIANANEKMGIENFTLEELETLYEKITSKSTDKQIRENIINILLNRSKGSEGAIIEHTVSLINSELSASLGTYGLTLTSEQMTELMEKTGANISYSSFVNYAIEQNLQNEIAAYQATEPGSIEQKKALETLRKKQEEICEAMANEIAKRTGMDSENIKHLLSHIYMYDETAGQNGGGHYDSKLLYPYVYVSNKKGNEVHRYYDNTEKTTPIKDDGKVVKKGVWPSDITPEDVITFALTSSEIQNLDDSQIRGNGNYVFDLTIGKYKFKIAATEEIFYDENKKEHYRKIVTIFPI